MVTVAGSFNPGSSGDGGSATSATLYNPGSFAASNDGSTIYIADTFNYRIRRVSGGNIYAFAGVPNQHIYNNDGLIATQTNINYPTGLFLTSTHLYYSDRDNNLIRRIDLTTNIVKTVVGVNYIRQFGTTCGSACYQGDGGPALQAKLQTPGTIFVAPNGELFIEDYNNNAIRKVTTDGNIETILQNGYSQIYSLFYYQGWVYYTTSANIYVLKPYCETNYTLSANFSCDPCPVDYVNNTDSTQCIYVGNGGSVPPLSSNGVVNPSNNRNETNKLN